MSGLSAALEFEELRADSPVCHREALADLITAVALACVRWDALAAALPPTAHSGPYTVSAQLSDVADRHLCRPVDYFLGKRRDLRDLQALINLPGVCCQDGGKSGDAEEAINHMSAD